MIFFYFFPDRTVLRVKEKLKKLIEQHLTISHVSKLLVVFSVEKKHDKIDIAPPLEAEAGWPA